MREIVLVKCIPSYFNFPLQITINMYYSHLFISMVIVYESRTDALCRLTEAWKQTVIHVFQLSFTVSKNSVIEGSLSY